MTTRPRFPSLGCMARTVRFVPGEPHLPSNAAVTVVAIRRKDKRAQVQLAGLYGHLYWWVDFSTLEPA